MPLLKHIKLWARSNALVLAAATFFVLWKFFLISTLWQDRVIPPGPDDSYIYILHIDSTLRCANLISCPERAFSFDTYGGFDHLSYRLLLGTIGKLFRFDATETYHFSFYFGTVILAGILIFFLKRLDLQSKTAVAFSLFTLALYNGSGSYHGFFWVVPSFFALISFFITFTLVTDHSIRRWYGWGALVVLFGLYSHILGLYLLAALPLYWLCFCFLTRRWDWTTAQRIAAILMMAVVFYVPVGAYFTYFSYGNPYGPEVIVKNIVEKKITNDAAIETTPTPTELAETHPFFTFDREHIIAALPGWPKIFSDYFRWIFPSPLGYFAFGTVLLILFSYRQYKLISLYLASLGFALMSSLSIHGERSLILIWPLTFLLYAQAAWIASRWIGSRLQHFWLTFFFRSSLIGIVIIAIGITSAYSFLWNQYMSQVRNIAVSEDLAQYLISTTAPNELVAYSKDMNFLDAYLMLQYGSSKPAKTIELTQANRYVTFHTENQLADAASYQSVFQDFFALVERLLLFQQVGSGIVPLAHPHVPGITFEIEKTFGPVEIYRLHHSVK